MKKIFFALTVLSLLTFPAPAQAEESARAAASSGDSAGKKIRAERPKKSFEERKAEAVARAQKRLNCVQAAQTPEALKSCYPMRRGHSGGKMRGKREGASPAPAQ